jgi:CheY-like chemotaxis protein
MRSGERRGSLNGEGNPFVILLADDDADDREMIQKALKSRLPIELRFVSDGEELLEYLHRTGKFSAALSSPAPQLILLDLNMPRKDGWEALAEIKAAPELRTIPVVVMTTSKAELDIAKTYDLGASSFICKPVTLARLTEVMQVLSEYWFRIVMLPAAHGQ